MVNVLVRAQGPKILGMCLLVHVCQERLRVSLSLTCVSHCVTVMQHKKKGYFLQTNLDAGGGMVFFHSVCVKIYVMCQPTRRVCV